MSKLEFRTLIKRSADAPTVVYEGICKSAMGAVYAIHGWERTPEEIRFGKYIASESTADALSLMVKRGTAPLLSEMIGEHRILDLLVNAAPLSRGAKVTTEQVADAMEQWLAVIRSHVSERVAAAE